MLKYFSRMAVGRVSLLTTCWSGADPLLNGFRIVMSCNDTEGQETAEKD